MGKIIAFTNQKGGVGKTTTCVNMSAYLAAMGKKVLIIDIDPQGNASSGLGVVKRTLTKSIYNCFVSDCAPEDAILKTSVNNLEIIPSNIDLAGAEVDLVYMNNREKVLKGILTRLRNNYDYITVDCPPSLGLLTINALTSCDSVFIPIQGEFYALEGLSQLMNTVKLVKKHLNPNLEIEGVVLTMYDSRSNLIQTVAEEIHKFFGKKVFITKIPRNVRLGESPSYGLPIMQFDPRSSGAIAYKKLTEELLERNSDSYEKITKDYLLRKKAVPADKE
ncbi:MAG: AAA family ATPase [Clostridiales bacterium]|jgi:chromosome partitioning protein|nr:AAA family ATPase [Clostridiales bacterium]